MKTYKHVKLWYVATKIDKKYYWVDEWQKNAKLLVWAEYIEWSNGREEVVEKDWIDDARQKFRESAYREEPHLSKNVFRTVIEKHAPGTKKFTRDEIIAFYSEGLPKTHWQHIDWAVQFLSKHNLLSDTD